MITPQLVSEAEKYTNALKQREILLREKQIFRIENLESTNNAFDVIDLTSNLLSELTNFPFLSRLTGLLVANNRIIKVDPKLGEALPDLKLLVLTRNLISSLAELQFLSGLNKLEHLTLVENPVASHSHYRLYVIWKQPSIRVLDFQKVKDSERKLAEEQFGSRQEPNPLAFEVLNGIKTVEPPKITTRLSEEEKEALRERLSNAQTLEEIDEIEALLRDAS